VAALGGALWRLPDAYVPRKPAWRPLGGAVMQFVAPGSTLVIPGSKRALFYASLDRYVSLRANRLLLLGRALPPATAARLRKEEKLWVLAHAVDWHPQLGMQGQAEPVAAFEAVPILWLVVPGREARAASAP
jgi:hypothetical protein